MPSPLLRPAVIADAEAILAIELACFATPGERFGLRQIRSLIANPNADVFVARTSRSLRRSGRPHHLIGWAVGLAKRTPSGAAIGRVYAVAVLPDARGQGLGRKLTERVMSALDARGAGRVFLEVRSDNAPAIGLYRSLGFADRHLVRDYYGRGLNALSMIRKAQSDPPDDERR